MSEFEAEFHELFDEIVEAFDKSTRPPTLPYQIAPLQYAGLGSFVPEEKPIDVNIFEFLPTRPTMRVQRKRDLLTGEVLGYEDMPIATDEQSVNGPFVGLDKSQNAGRSGSSPTGGMDDVELEAALRALDTGIGLLSSPFDDETCTDIALEPPPELPADFKETVVQDPWEERPKETALTYFGTIDTWDTKNFNTEIKNPACTFPHALDEFQMRAIRRLERREHVFVSAPTSAGKTVVAQYAISLCIGEKMRAIYTSPIKALSNQKYYDFSRQYPSVGILTGDVSLNRDAGVLIMTTEILRGMLYRGDDVLRDVGCVIFDECHYISDEERGVVWEESIMLMPDHINMVFLSATVPNDEQIATWIARTKRRTVYIERHEKRPVPLSHHLYVEGKLFNVYGADCVFNDEQYNKANQRFREQCVTRGKVRGQYNGTVQKSNAWYRDVVKTLKQKDLLPALIFSFSQKKVADLGRAVQKIDLATEAEKTQIRAETRRIMARLDPIDRQLPQVRETLALVEQGIGVHHSGMLVILKECVEILFIKGLLKVLFCTSTFAMGINAPARTCVFTTLKKYNGKERAELTPTEYIQMSGRAGRRGKDTVGNVIILCIESPPDKQYLKNIVSGKAERLHSQFHVRWNMVLNIERTEGMSMSSFVNSSLFADADASKISGHHSRIEKLRQMLADLPPIDCPQDIEDTYAFGHQVDALKDMTKALSSSFDVISSLSPGQIVCLVTDETVTAALLRRALPDGKKFEFITESDKSRSLKLNVVKESVVGFYPKQIPHFEVVSPTDLQLELKKIRETTELRPLCGNNKHVATDIRQKAGELVAQYEALSKSPCFTCHHMAHHLSESLKRVKIEKEIEQADQAIEQTNTKYDSQTQHYRDFLTSLGYIEDNVVTLKGQICTELQSLADEVLATELLFRNTFDNLAVEDICAVCAALTTEKKRKKDDEVDIPRHLQPVMDDVQMIAEELVEQMVAADIEDVDDWVERRVNPIMVGPMYKWAKGDPLCNVLTNQVPEGTFIAAALKVAGLLGKYRQAAGDLGNRDLENKFDMGVAMCQRGIACLESLYLQ